MNNDFYQYALDVIDNLTDDEIEAGLRDFGIECQRKVSVFNEVEADILGEFSISWPPTRTRKILEQHELASIDCAANDNSYALAA
jgi:hypothetical protein